MEPLWHKLSALPFFSSRPEKWEGSGAPPSLTAFIRSLFKGKALSLELYATALTHRSMVHDTTAPEITRSNQRLEFLGDSVLGLIISEYLYRRFPEGTEGELSSYRAKIVNGKSLAGFARNLDLGIHLIIGESADQQRIRTSTSTLADAFEALTGAIYLDRGLDAVREFIEEQIIDSPAFEAMVSTENNHKSRLIEHTQSHQLPPPVYTVLSEEGAEHEKTFTIEVSCNGRRLGRGTALRKKDAEQLAAEEAMGALERALTGDVAEDTPAPEETGRG
ncbi:ribonuclease III [Pelodictyon luteolum]|uniref:Ribonuclease 3 n=1 Tax=Chlorobium luteolum (strain DSM 273 / BCRC 81028 / 2530) TaxID=319225 RepID=RNC_CHLL3|nr:ribonuclease III [Pelodictyon luteolum]Q3B6L3.1 RecName: Full=Ribonuclease 3; AltName: Full=Ribonuclease III; Short=RNase III [Pelodictyon luteolum DSM 273]ABB23018.1 RNAse III [Pelodictyon luteolum DSM 273]